ncbi:MAG: HAMP domain-containing protein, partial [Proteobacteria bacterium]|nr:HAMP domain-containing protein [Pseudomonadota bacterium]
MDESENNQEGHQENYQDGRQENRQENQEARARKRAGKARTGAARGQRSGGSDPAPVRDNGFGDLGEALRKAAAGDFSVRVPADAMGAIGSEFNALMDLNEMLIGELARVSGVIVEKGRLKERMSLGRAGGAWERGVEAVNTMIGSLAQPTAEVERVITAVAKGDLTQEMALEIEGRPLQGEFLKIGRTANTMVAQLNAFAEEVSRVAKEVGTEGKLGGQAKVKGVSGTWKELTENVNQMASNLTGQVRNIAEVTKAVAQGDLSKKITVDVKGGVLELKDTINTMVDQL